MQEDNTPRPIAWLVPLIIGLAVFGLTMPIGLVRPGNINWLAQDDEAQHYLGWVFFRHGAWHLPLGLNPDYGQELSSSVLFTDSNPLLALICKAVGGFLPEPFQYMGLIIALCIVLQAFAAWSLTGRITPHRCLRTLGTALLTMAPPMLFRFPGHLNLAAHFLIIWALWLNLAPLTRTDPAFPRRMRIHFTLWTVLLCTAALTHAYLAAMTLALWLADLARHALNIGRAHLPRLIGLNVITLAVLALTAWQAGYFISGTALGSDGFGSYRMNLLSVLNPQSWSYVLKDIPTPFKDYEGYNYLGLGLIFLAICGLPIVLSGQVNIGHPVRQNLPLAVILLGLGVFSLSNTVGLGMHSLHYPLPARILQMADVFRASGRMFWPVFYMLGLGILWVIIRHTSPRVATTLLAAALVMQVADTSAGWLPRRHNLRAAEYTPAPQILQDPFWEQAAQDYKQIRVFYPMDVPGGWVLWGQFAAGHRLKTNIVFLARVNMTAIEHTQAEGQIMIGTGRYRPDAFYILNDNLVEPARAHLNPNTDLLTRIDGFNVLAPGWKTRHPATAEPDLHLGILHPGITR